MDGVFAINLGPAVDVLSSLVFAALSGLATYAVYRLLDWLKISEDEKVRGYLQVAVDNGLAFARAQAIKALGRPGLTTKHEQVAHAANYVIARVPDALKRFGLDEAAVKDLVTARLGVRAVIAMPQGLPAPAPVPTQPAGTPNLAPGLAPATPPA